MLLNTSILLQLLLTTKKNNYETNDSGNYRPGYYTTLLLRNVFRAGEKMLTPADSRNALKPGKHHLKTLQYL